MIPLGRDLKQIQQRFYYVMRKIGVSKAQLGITPHGLRHEYANDLYEAESGQKSPVRGGRPDIDPDLDDKARRIVAQELGHTRERIVSRYTGARPMARRQKHRAPAASAQ